MVAGAITDNMGTRQAARECMPHAVRLQAGVLQGILGAPAFSLPAVSHLLPAWDQESAMGAMNRHGTCLQCPHSVCSRAGGWGANGVFYRTASCSPVLCLFRFWMALFPEATICSWKWLINAPLSELSLLKRGKGTCCALLVHLLMVGLHQNVYVGPLLVQSSQCQVHCQVVG